MCKLNPDKMVSLIIACVQFSPNAMTWLHFLTRRQFPAWTNGYDPSILLIFRWLDYISRELFPSWNIALVQRHWVKLEAMTHEMHVMNCCAVAKIAQWNKVLHKMLLESAIRCFQFPWMPPRQLLCENDCSVTGLWLWNDATVNAFAPPCGTLYV